MILVGVALLTFGMSQLWPQVRLVLFGKRANAEAVWVAKTKVGLPPVILKTDPEIEAHREPRDRSYVFWNAFSYTTQDGRSIIVRPAVGSELGPLYDLLDNDGLPTTLPVYYDPADPQSVAFPLIVSTWLSPAIILLGGIFATIIGTVLLYWANKPIEMPHIPTLEEIEVTHRLETASEESGPPAKPVA
jgi:hypothetical protein